MEGHFRNMKKKLPSLAQETDLITPQTRFTLIFKSEFHRQLYAHVHLCVCVCMHTHVHIGADLIKFDIKESLWEQFT